MFGSKAKNSLKRCEGDFMPERQGLYAKFFISACLALTQTIGWSELSSATHMSLAPYQNVCEMFFANDQHVAKHLFCFGVPLPKIPEILNRLTSRVERSTVPKVCREENRHSNILAKISALQNLGGRVFLMRFKFGISVKVRKRNSNIKKTSFRMALTN